MIYIVVMENFVVWILDNIVLDVVVLLFCVGIIMYLFFCYWGVVLGKKVVIVGMGGFGYMVVKIVYVMGVEVIVLF